MISRFYHSVKEILVLLGHYALQIASYLLTFHNLTVPPFRVKQQDCLTLEDGTVSK